LSEPLSHRERLAWLTPGLILQLATILVGISLAWAALSAELRGLAKQQAETAVVMKEIRSEMPNAAALNERLRSLESRLDRLDRQYETQAVYIQNMRERMARNDSGNFP
jgi:Tfp pilus assembly protein PilO